MSFVNKYRIDNEFVTYLFSRWTIFLQIFCLMLSFLRFLQSEFTTREELNRVKNIFKNCCSILLNNETIIVMRNIWINNCLKSKCYIQINQQNFQQNSQLFTNDRRSCLRDSQKLFIFQKIFYIHVLLDELYTSTIANVSISMR